MKFLYLVRHLYFLLFCAVFFSCGFEIPRRLHVTTETSLHIPIGRAAGIEELDEILSYTSSEKIASLLSGADARVYQYVHAGDAVPLPLAGDPLKNAAFPLSPATAVDPSKTRTLLIHIPVSSLNFDFTDYMKTSINVPPVLGDAGGLPPLGWGTPLPQPVDISFSIPLGDMAQWVESINLNDTGGIYPNVENTSIRLKGAAGLFQNLRLSAPAVGIGANADDVAAGQVDGGDLVFYAAHNVVLTPVAQREIEVKLRFITMPQLDGPYPVEIDLQWTQSSVNPGANGVFEGNFSFALGSLSNFLRDYALTTAPAYIYVNGLMSHNAQVQLYANSKLLSDKTVQNNYDFNAHYDFNGEFFDAPIDAANAGDFNMAGLLNDAKGNNIDIGYKISVNNWIVNNDGTGGTISADMILFMPMRFVMKQEKTEVVNGKTYSLLYQRGADGRDLFSRGAGFELGDIKQVAIRGTDMQNTLLDNDVFLRIKTDTIDTLTAIKKDADFSIEFFGSPFLPNPFSPEFKVYIEKPAGQTVIQIKPKIIGTDDIFDVRLDADVLGVINYEQDL